jgi:hypothetical protein
MTTLGTQNEGLQSTHVKCRAAEVLGGYQAFQTLTFSISLVEIGCLWCC